MMFKDETNPDVTFEEFCATHGLEVVVRERSGVVGTSRYYAFCDSVDVKEDDGMLTGGVGNGSTKECAVSAYVAGLRGKSIVIGAMTTRRKTIRCPNVWKVL
jgi:hypothetical protein